MITDYKKAVFKMLRKEKKRGNNLFFILFFLLLYTKACSPITISDKGVCI